MKKRIFFYVITGLNVLIAAGFAVAGIIDPTLIVNTVIPDDRATLVFALYGATRAIPLAILFAISIFRKAHESALVALAVLAGCIQLMDGLIGIYLNDPFKYLGPFILAALTFVSIYLVGMQQENR